MVEKPYIGVTGATTREEVNHLVRVFYEKGRQTTEHQPMIGFLVSYKTLNGQETLNRRYPRFESIPSLLKEDHFDSFTTIHYNSKELTSLADQVKKIFKEQIYEENLCRGIQLNIPWPPIEELTKIKRELPDLKIIMQLSHSCLDESPVEVATKVKNYGELIDYVLIDPSGGKGKSFEIAKIKPYYNEIKSYNPELIIGFAGGFTGENAFGRIKEIISLTGEKNFSIDAESGLRDQITTDYGNDVYNKGKVENYIKETRRAFL